MEKEIEKMRAELLADIWQNHKQFLRDEKVKKSDIVDYVENIIEPMDEWDNMHYYGGYFRALEAVEKQKTFSDDEFDIIFEALDFLATDYAENSTLTMRQKKAMIKNITLLETKLNKI